MARDPGKSCAPRDGTPLALVAGTSCSPPRSRATLVGLDAHPVRVEVEASRGAAVLRPRRPRRGGGPREPRSREERARAARRRHERVPRRREPRAGGREEERQRLRPRDRRGDARARSARCPPRRSRACSSLGELSLDGDGAAACAASSRSCSAPRRAGFARAIVPRANAAEAVARRRGSTSARRARSASSLAALEGGAELPVARGPAEAPPSHAAGRRSRRRARAGRRAARARDRRGGRAQPAHDRPARRRQDDARAPPARASCRRSRPTRRSRCTAIHSVAGLLVADARSRARARSARRTTP